MLQNCFHEKSYSFLIDFFKIREKQFNILLENKQEDQKQSFSAAAFLWNNVLFWINCTN